MSNLNKYCYYITMHNHVGELSINKDCFNDEEYFVNNLDVVINCNKKDIDREKINEIASQYNAKQVKVIFDEVNEGGYLFGAIEQISHDYDILSKYKVVLHTHPDVYPLDSFGIKTHLEKCETEGNDFMFFELPDRRGSGGYESQYAQDFFMFVPSEKNRNGFDCWKTFIENKPGYAGEIYLYEMFSKQNVGFLDRRPCAGMQTSYEPYMGIVSNPGGNGRPGGSFDVVQHQRGFVDNYLNQKTNKP